MAKFFSVYPVQSAGWSIEGANKSLELSFELCSQVLMKLPRFPSHHSTRPCAEPSPPSPALRAGPAP